MFLFQFHQMILLFFKIKILIIQNYVILKSRLYYFVNCLFTTCKLVDIPINNSKKKKRQKKTGSHTVLDCGIDMGLVSAGGTCGIWHHLWYAHLFLFSVEEPYGDSKCPKVSLGIESVVAGQPDGIRTHQTPIVAFGRRRRW